MDFLRSLREDFGIKEDCVVVISDDRFNCLIPSSWLESNVKNIPDTLPIIPENLFKSVHKNLASLILARSTAKQHFEGFIPVVINAVQKNSKVVESFVEDKLCVESSLGDFSNIQVRSRLDFLSNKCFEKEAAEKFSHAYSAGKCKLKKLPIKEHNTIIVDVLEKLYGRKPVPTENYVRNASVLKSDILESSDNYRKINDHSAKQFIASHPSIHPVYLVAETSIAYFIFQPFFRHTLADVVAFSPLKLSETSCKMFVYFEILMAVRHLHSLGINVNNLRLSDFSIDDMLWVKIISLNFKNFYRLRSTVKSSKSSVSSTEEERLTMPKYTPDLHFPLGLKATLHDLPQIMQGWIHGVVSNFDYLMVLNKLSGRSINEPNHHPILPWVLDLSNPSHANFRDLTKSKYRLNKGDVQLDLTFDSTNPESMMGHPNQTPFHVSDFLSDITYYVYIARKSPQDVLCRIVRPRWQPNHYPPNIGRLYEWTPDECIPAFYLDHDIFKSCHKDLSDLELPLWASSPRDFIKMHWTALESAEVSQNLHHWIDLTFGFRLGGIAAMESKNVCLQLVDKHKSLMNHGVVQLFTSAHPPRRMNVSEKFSSHFPLVAGEASNECPHLEMERSPMDRKHCKRNENINFESKIDEKTVDPLADLDHLEKFFHFCVQETHSLDKDFGKKNHDEMDQDEVKASIVSRDMQTLGCLGVELFFGKVMSSLSPDESSLQERYSLCRGLAFNHFHELPFFIKKCVAYLMNLPPSRQRPISKWDSEFGAAFTYPAVNFPNDLPPPSIDLLLVSQTGVLVLPSYINQLYQCLSSFHKLVPSVDVPHLINPQGMNHLLNFLRNFFYLECNKNSDMIYTVVFPYVEFLLEGSIGNEALVSAAWNLFYFCGKCCSDARQNKSMLLLMINLFMIEETSPSFLKIYHRSFVSQMIMIFKLKLFLKNFSTLLVEAVSGFKNFSCNEKGPIKSTSIVSMETKLEEEEYIEANESFDDDCVKNVETDEFDKGHDLLLLDGENEGDLDDTKSIKSGCPSTASFDDDEFSARSDAANHNAMDASNVDNPSCDEEGSLPTKEDLSSSKIHQKLPQFMQEVEDINSCNISDVAKDTIKWLSDKLGPVLTAKYLSRNLLRMLVICYIPPLQLEPIVPSTCLGFEAYATGKYVQGDLNALEIAECLLYISHLYGEQVILIQYLQHIKELISSVVSCETLMPKREGYVISSITLLLIILPHMSITSLVDSLQVLECDIIFPILNLLSSSNVNFSTTSPSSRSFVAFRLVDIIALISIRLGFDVTRCKIMHLIKKFFDGFKTIENVLSEGNFQNDLEDTSVAESSQVHVSTHRRQQSLDAIFKDGGDSSQQQDENKEISKLQANIQKQLNATYTCELAHYAYVTFCKLAGGICIEQNLDNDDFLRKMCSNYDSSILASENRTSSAITDPRISFIGISDNLAKDDIAVEGNKIIIKSNFTPKKNNNLSTLPLVANPDQSIPDESQKRTLRGDWLAYWEHEVGCGHDTLNFKQIKLQTFKGHSSGVRCMVIMDSENSFISAGKDHMVKLWSIRNQDDGSAIVPCQASYEHHKKAISSLLYVDSLKQVVSCDGSVHIWDPFNMSKVRKVLLKSSPISVLTSLPPPSSILLTSSNDSVIRMLDCRVGKFVQSNYLKTSVIPSGHIKSISVGDDGHHVAMGFSSGIITTLDIRTGGYISSWKAYDSDIVEMKVLGNSSILAFSLDLGANVWSFPSGKLLFPIRGMLEGARWINHSESALTFGYPSNRITICTRFDANKKQGDLVNIKLKSDLIKGSLSSMALLPLNHLLLLASDHGDVTLVA